MSDEATSSSTATSIGWSIAFAVFLAGFVAFAVMFDVFAAGQHLVALFGVAALFGAPALLVALICRRRRMLVTCGVVGAVMAILFVTPWHPRKRFVSDLFAVKPGMTVDEVESVMGGYMTGAGKQWAVPAGPAPVVLAEGEVRPDAEELAARVRAAQDAYVAPRYPEGEERAHATGTMTYRWTDNSDWGQVTYFQGRVVKVEFLPD